MRIVPARSISGFFLEAVSDSMRARGLEVTGGAEQYVVGLLTDYAHPDERAEEPFERSLTLLFEEAVRLPDPGKRFEKLRTLGDGVLYGCGFFSDHFEARGVNEQYLHGLGTKAYQTAGAMLRSPSEGGSPDLFAELARNFAAFAGVISDVADMTIALGTETARGLLKAYERWLKTGSERLASALATRGVVPTRGRAGVLQ